MIYIIVLKTTKIAIHPFQAAKLVLLLVNKTLIKIPFKYSDYSDVFLSNLAVKLLEHIGINDHIIKIEADKHLLYGLINSLGPMELETLKTYIEIYLKPRFIQVSKSLRSNSILFN